MSFALPETAPTGGLLLPGGSTAGLAHNVLAVMKKTRAAESNSLVHPQEYQSLEILEAPIPSNALTLVALLGVWWVGLRVG